MKRINVLSLFDGMACGMLAFQKAGIPLDNYYAYEIDKYAIQTAKYNFPYIQECGDVFNANFTKYSNIDYLIGGSPCTYWSIAQSPDKRETTASGIGWELFSQYVRALNQAKPKYFIYENNKSMSKAIRESITETFGFEAICINSALVSAQNRQRLYWVGKRNADGTYSKVDVEQPEDRGILLKDILDGADLTNCEKSYCLTSSYDGACAWNTIERHQRNMVAEPVNTPTDGNLGAQPTALQEQPYGRAKNASGFYDRRYEAKTDEKSPALTSVESRRLVAIPIPGVAEPVNVTADGKAQCLRATCYKDGVRNIAGNDIDKKTGVAEPVCMRYERSDKAKQLRKDYESGKIKHGYHEYHELQPRTDGKTYTVYEVKDGNITIKSKTYPIKLQDGYYIIRKLTVSECKRLQTVPKWYEFPVSNTRAYSMLGNGWTVDVIVHLIEATTRSC